MTSTDIKPIRRRKLSDHIQERLLDLIHGSDIAPGDKLPSERELMRAYEVGRPAIREAMQNLERMGLIEIKHGERPRVAEPSITRMVEQMSESMRHLLVHSPANLEHLKEGPGHVRNPDGPNCRSETGGERPGPARAHSC